MVSWSALGRSFGINILKSNLKSPVVINNVKFSTSKCTMGGHHKVLDIQPSRFQYQKFKDMFHYYMMIGLIPVTGIILYCNIFIGPATLEACYDPKNPPEYWEFHRHPITRFIARYLHNNPQQEYEKFMHYIDEEEQKAKLRGLENKIRQKMSERNDYKSFYYRPVVNKYLRINKQAGDELEGRLGENYSDK